MESQQLKRFPGGAKNRSINDDRVHTGNSSVLRHAVLRTGFPHVLAEFGLRLPERSNRTEISGRIRTFLGTECRSMTATYEPDGAVGFFSAGSFQKRRYSSGNSSSVEESW
jgi:hypothetical protein